MGSNTMTTLSNDDVVETLQSLFVGFNLSENGLEGRGRAPRSTHNDIIPVQDAIKKFRIKVESQNGKGPSKSIPISSIILYEEHTKGLKKIVNELKKTIVTLTEATEKSIIQDLEILVTESGSFANGEGPIRDILSHFHGEIRKIARGVLKTHNDESVLWRVAEECYTQAISPSGVLNAEKYLDATLPRDGEGRFDTRSKSWIDFWISALNSSSKGSTLFYPPIILGEEPVSLDLPTYLFRVFDKNSSGKNNQNIIASTASYKLPKSNIDIFSMEDRKAAEMLQMHLDKFKFGVGKNEDNLMSWTSSFLFAIQYAIWRKYNSFTKVEFSEIKFCIIETRNFPRGQFARDLALIEAYRPVAASLDAAKNFFDFRVRFSEYYNGEYLSQGRLDHLGRSLIVSLKDLERAGLFKLYSEFKAIEGRDKWANRVKELRSKWSAEQQTTDQEIQTALRVARECFAQLGQLDVATMLLSFKDRRYSELVDSLFQSDLSFSQPDWASKPVEVYRYWRTSKAIEYYKNLPEKQAHGQLPNDELILREIYA